MQVDFIAFQKVGVSGGAYDSQLDWTLWAHLASCSIHLLNGRRSTVQAIRNFNIFYIFYAHFTFQHYCDSFPKLLLLIPNICPSSLLLHVHNARYLVHTIFLPQHLSFRLCPRDFPHLSNEWLYLPCCRWIPFLPYHLRICYRSALSMAACRRSAKKEWGETKPRVPLKKWRQTVWSKAWEEYSEEAAG